MSYTKVIRIYVVRSAKIIGTYFHLKSSSWPKNHDYLIKFYQMKMQGPVLLTT